MSAPNPDRKPPDKALTDAVWEKFRFQRGTDIRKAALRSHKALSSDISALFPATGTLDVSRVAEFLQTRRADLNHVCLTDILHRVAERTLACSNDHRGTLQAAGELVLREFLSPRVKAGPREIATACRAVGFLQLQNDELLDGLARRVKRLQHAFEPMDFVFTIGGLVALPEPSQKIRDLVAACCIQFRGQVQDCEPDILLLLMKGLCRSNATEPELVAEINKAVVAAYRNDKPYSDIASLDRLATLTRCNSTLQHISPDILDYTAREFLEVTSKSYDEWRHYLSVEAAADFVWGAAAAAYPLSPTLISRLEAHVYSELPSVTDTQKRRVLSGLATSAFIVMRGAQGAQRMGAFSQLEYEDFMAPPCSGAERGVHDALMFDLKVPFQREIPLGPYRLDFVLKRADGRLVDLEIDGDRFHLLYDISSQAMTDRYRGGHVIRDSIAALFGYEVVRVRASEWVKAPDKAALLREKLGPNIL